MPWPTVPVVTTGMDADTDNLPRADILDHTNKFNQLIAMRGVAGGVCDLDASALIPSARLPAVYQPLDAQLTTLAGITAQQAADLGSITDYVGTLMSRIDAAAFRAAIGADVPPGVVIYTAQGSPPTGYIKADGAAVNRTTYAALFSAIGTTYGAGDGSTTFNVPDLRGEFIRGWDDGRGVDVGRALGSTQGYQVEAHAHTGGMNSASLGGGAAGSTVGTGPVSTGTTGGNETRPRNVALLACIKT